MKKKGLLCFFAAAVLTAGILTGCGQAGVEHRFEADSLTASQEAAVRETARTLSRMDSLLEQHQLQLDAALQELPRPVAPAGDPLQQGNLLDKVTAWLENTSQPLYLYQESTEEADWVECMVLWQDQLDQIQRALSQLDAEQWAKLEGTLYLRARQTVSQGQFYLETSLSTRSPA